LESEANQGERLDFVLGLIQCADEFEHHPLVRRQRHALAES
jgi:hypothetical protein